MPLLPLLSSNFRIDTSAQGFEFKYSIVAGWAIVADDVQVYQTGHVWELEDMPHASGDQSTVSRFDASAIEDCRSTESDRDGEQEDWMVLFADTSDNFDSIDSMWGAGVCVAPG